MFVLIFIYIIRVRVDLVKTRLEFFIDLENLFELELELETEFESVRAHIIETSSSWLSSNYDLLPEERGTFLFQSHGNFEIKKNCKIAPRIVYALFVTHSQQ